MPRSIHHRNRNCTRLPHDSSAPNHCSILRPLHFPAPSFPRQCDAGEEGRRRRSLPRHRRGRISDIAQPCRPRSRLVLCKISPAARPVRDSRQARRSSCRLSSCKGT
uniref:Uncharacterized protein n=1 Tax=Zea mays TaxID=4577 RepID=A0A804NAQ8_MAIZE